MAEDSSLVFGPFRVDTGNECLWRGKQRVTLAPKAFAVLRYLLEHSGRVVRKEEFFDAIWPKTVVSDIALAVCIREIRKAVGDDSRAPRYIETVHRRGYRFLWSSSSPSPQTALPFPDKPSLVVLPFTNMSGDSEQEYFNDGMTDTLITDLSQLSGLFVIDRNSAFTYKGKAVTVQEVSKELGVRYVLEGSVQKANNRVRINVQLIDATTNGHVWAEQRVKARLKEVWDRFQTGL